MTGIVTVMNLFCRSCCSSTVFQVLDGHKQIEFLFPFMLFVTQFNPQRLMLKFVLI